MQLSSFIFIKHRNWGWDYGPVKDFFRKSLTFLFIIQSCSLFRTDLNVYDVFERKSDS